MLVSSTLKYLLVRFSGHRKVCLYLLPNMLHWYHLHKCLGKTYQDSAQNHLHKGWMNVAQGIIRFSLFTNVNKTVADEAGSLLSWKELVWTDRESVNLLFWKVVQKKYKIEWALYFSNFNSALLRLNIFIQGLSGNSVFVRIIRIWGFRIDEWIRDLWPYFLNFQLFKEYNFYSGFHLQCESSFFNDIMSKFVLYFKYVGFDQSKGELEFLITTW